jgi:hypothetical protein
MPEVIATLAQPMVGTNEPIRLHRPQMVRSENFRRKALTLLKAFQSGRASSSPVGPGTVPPYTVSTTIRLAFLSSGIASAVVRACRVALVAAIIGSPALPVFGSVSLMNLWQAANATGADGEIRQNN